MLMIRPPPPWLDHLLRRELDAEERALEVDGDDEVELALGRLEDRRPRLHPGVVDHDVEPAEGRHGPVDERLDVGHARHVGPDRPGPCPPAASIAFTVASAAVRVLVVVDRDRRALARELQRDRVADPAVAAGDDRGLAVQ